MAARLKQFFTSDHGWAEFLFRPPPRKPDARMVYVGGCGFITLIRGLFYLFGTPPQAVLFDTLGRGFTIFWSATWVLVGLGVMVIAGTGHRWPNADRLAAFGMLMLWWVWGLLFIVSGIFFDTDRRLMDVFSGVTFIVTGIIIAAGVVQGLRKTREIQLREVAVTRIRELEEVVIQLSAENEVLRGSERNQ